FHDTYFVIAHFHYTFFPIAFISVFSAVTFWFPKMFGRMMNETFGKIHFWGTIIPFNFIFIPLFVLGIRGDHRRIYDYQHFPDLMKAGMQDLRILATLSLVTLISFQFIFLANFFYSLFKGPKASANPWQSNTLQWVAA